MSSNVVVKHEDGQLYLVPEGTPPDEADKGIPLAVDLSFTPSLVKWELFRDLLAQRGLVVPEDFNRPGAYDRTADALRAFIKITANEIVDHIRSNMT